MININEKRKQVESGNNKHGAVKGFKQKLLFFYVIPGLSIILDIFLRITRIKSLGIKNALNLKLEEVDFLLRNIPYEFHGTRILFISDLHIDGKSDLKGKIISMVKDLEYDFCILGGDYAFKIYNETNQTFKFLEEIVGLLKEKTKVFGILGNHDRSVIAEALDKYGVELLINKTAHIERNGQNIYLSGLDDSIFFGSDDLNLTDNFSAKEDGFKIMISHSPDLYKEVAQRGYSLYLAGHTHGGQVCLPGGYIMINDTESPSYMLKGKWKYKEMLGYTSRGVGTSLVPVRFFCPPELTLITLKKDNNN